MSEILMHVFETYIVLPYIHGSLTLSEGSHISTVNVCRVLFQSHTTLQQQLIRLRHIFCPLLANKTKGL